MTSGLEFSLLGPLVVRDHGRPVPLGSRRRERCLLGLLLLEPGRSIGTDRLINLLWDELPPANAKATLSSHVSRLRTRLDPDRRGLLRNRRDGYLIEVAPDQVDAHCFESAVGRAEKLIEPAARSRALRAALALWRGPLLADVATDRLRGRVGAGWEERRIAALESRLGADLACGRHAQLLAELTGLLAVHPDREPLVSMTMLALYRTGRQAEALEVFRQARTRLAAEFGVEPGPDLQQTHTAILRHEVRVTAGSVTGPADAPMVARPAQLPAPPRFFRGRVSALRELDGLFATDDTLATVVVAIVGTAGVGKTALALHWAARNRDRFPDGQLYVNLRAFAGAPPVPATQALTQVLRDLGVPADRMPGDPEGAAATYRTLVADRRMLIVLDDAEDVEQARPLLPGTPTSLVLITSRHRLRGLTAMDGAHRISLAPLPTEDAVAVLDAVLGGSGPPASPHLISALAEACGRLPLALRIAAANLQDDPIGDIEEYLRRLVAQPLTSLAIDDDPSAAVRRVLDLSYARLPVDARRLFRLLGLAPTADVSLPPAAALAGLSEPRAGRLVQCLSDTHLLHEPRPGRYAMHELVRVYAAERVHVDESPAVRDLAVERWLDWYLAAAAGAQALLAPHRAPREPVLRHPVPELPFRADRHETLAFLSGERDGLAATVELAVRRGDDRAAADLAYLLAGYFQLTGDGPDSMAVYQHGLLAAHRLSDPFLQSSLHNSLAICHGVARRFGAAVVHLRQSRAHARSAGDPAAEAAALMNLGRLYAEQGHIDDALAGYEQSLEVRRRHGLTRRLGYLLNNIGCLYGDHDEPDRALDYLGRALAAHRANDDENGAANTLDSIGVVHLQCGRHDTAIGYFQDAMAAAARSGDSEAEGTSLHHLGTAYQDRGDLGAAVEHLRRAAEHYQRLDDHHRESIARRYLAEAHLAAGHPDAVTQLRRALDLRALTPDPGEEATLHRALGDVEHRAGNDVAARYHWGLAVQRFTLAGRYDQAAALRSRATG